MIGRSEPQNRGGLEHLAGALARVVSAEALTQIEAVVLEDIHREPGRDPGARRELISALRAVRVRNGAWSGHDGGGTAGLLVSIRDATRMVAVTSRTLTRWAASGEVTATRVGREWRVSLAEVTAKAERQQR